MRADFEDAIAAARARYPGVQLYALGESMGAAVVLSDLAGLRPPALDGVILVAPAVWSRSDMPLSYRVVLWLTAHTLPGPHRLGPWCRPHLAVRTISRCCVSMRAIHWYRR